MIHKKIRVFVVDSDAKADWIKARTDDVSISNRAILLLRKLGERLKGNKAK